MLLGLHSLSPVYLSIVKSICYALLLIEVTASSLSFDSSNSRGALSGVALLIFLSIV
jgi:hypothetical protein